MVDRSLTSMRDLLDTAISEVRLSAGTHEAKRISVAGFLEEIEGAASLQAAHREMSLSFAVPAGNVTVNADPQLLASALFNLLQNAFKYSIPHGHVTVRAVRDGERISIEVEDECGGLPQGNTETLFSVFGARRGRDRSGLGLGLAVSRKAMRAIGGDIQTRSLPGKGCVFAIELPVAAPALGGSP